MKMKKYDINGQVLGEEALEEGLLSTETASQLLKDVLVNYQRNKRQWSASTLGRSEVDHTKKKPHRQKGTGGARQGSLAAPQYKGGGVVFGPKPKFNQNRTWNKKERRAALRQMLCQKLKDGKACLLEDPKLSIPKTKVLTNFLKQTEHEKSLLFVGKNVTWDSADEDARKQFAAIQKSVSNIPKVKFITFENACALDLAKVQNLVILDTVWPEVVQFLQVTKKEPVKKGE